MRVTSLWQTNTAFALLEAGGHIIGASLTLIIKMSSLSLQNEPS